jgi:tetratricopeptide (TPR) repeat protein
MRTSYAVFALFICLLATPAAARPSSADSIREVMKECDATSNGEDAIRACEELIRTRRYKSHVLSMIYNNIGIAQAQMSNFERAVEALSDAIRADTRYALPRINRARNLASLSRLSDAIADLDGALKLAPSADTYSLRGDFKDRNNDLGGALADYSEAIKLQPRVALHYSNRANVFAKLSQHTDAIEDYSRAIQINPRDPYLYLSRGLAWANAGKCDQAVPDYTKAVELSPRMSNAYNNRGVCLSRAGKRDEAIADYEAALKWDSGNERARNNLANIRNITVPRPVPLIIEVPKFDIPPVQKMLELPEFPVDVPAIVVGPDK